MDWKKFLLLACVGLVILAVLFAVGFISAPSRGTASQLSATVFLAGPVSGASVGIYALSKNGTRGELLGGPALTDGNGSASVDFTQSADSDYMLVESSGGSYYDTGAGSQAALFGSDVIQAVAPSDSTDISLTPFTSMAASLAMQSMKKGASAKNAVGMANTALSQQYRIRSIIDTTPIAASDPDAVSRSGRRQRDYGILLSGFGQLALSLNARPASLMQALAKDWSDGAVDGMEGSKPVTFDASGAPATLPPRAGLDGIQKGIGDFMASPAHSEKLPEFSVSTQQACANTGFYIDVTELPVWWNGEHGWFALRAAGGNPPYSWKLKGGSSLPSGFGLDADGNLSGIGNLEHGSAESISPPFIVEATDSSSPPRTCDAALRLIVTEKPPAFSPPEITCEAGKECSVDLNQFVDGGVPPYHFYSVGTDGPYPLDMMVWSGGTLRGTPSHAGSYEIGVCVVDMIGGGDCNIVAVEVNEKQAPPKPPDNGGDGTPACEPGHHAVNCGGGMRCCLNGWVCCGGGCSPPAFC